MPEGLKIQIGGEIGPLEAALKQAESDTKAFGAKVQQVFTQMGAGVNRSVGELSSRLRDGVAAGQNFSAGLKKELTALESAFVDSVKPISQLKKELAALQTAFEGTTQPTQLVSFSSQIKKLELQLSNLIKSASGPVPISPLESAFVNVLKPIQQLELEISALKQAFATTTEPALLRKYSDRISQLQTQISNIKVVGLENQFKNSASGATAAANGFGKLSKGSNEATQSLINIGRVFQDLPFGIIGVANNINPLVESFQRLKTSTGTTGGALKALGSSLVGGGGLGLAVSVITSLLSFASIGLSAFTRGASGAKSSVDATKSAFEEFQETLKGVASSIGGNVSRVTFLFEALNSGALSLNQRKTALEELKGINNTFFGSLREEKGLIDNLKSAYDAYLLNLLQIGRTKAIEAELTKLFNKKLELELQIDPKFLGATSKTVQIQLGRLRKELEKLGGPVDVSKAFDPFDESLKRRTFLLQEIRRLEQGETFIIDAGDSAAQINDVNLRIEALSKLLGNIGQFDIKPATEKVIKGIEELRVGVVKELNGFVPLIEGKPLQLPLPLQFIIDEAKAGLSFSNLKRELEDRLKQFALNQSSVPLVLKQQIEVDPNLLLPPGIRNEIVTELSSQFASGTPLLIEGINVSLDKTKLRQQVQTQIADALSGVASESFSTIGDAIGDALSGESLKGAFESFAKIISQGLKSIGTALIKAGTLALLAKTALGKIFSNPAFAIGAGVALVALSRVIANSFAGAREKGGPVQRGLNYLVNERGKEMFVPNNGGSPAWIEGGAQMFRPTVSGKILSASMAKSFAANFKIPKFNTGGLVQGPTFGLLGEGAGISSINPEVVAPLAMLKPLLGYNSSNNINVTVTGRLRNREIMLGQNRENRSQRRTSNGG